MADYRWLVHSDSDTIFTIFFCCAAFHRYAWSQYMVMCSVGLIDYYYYGANNAIPTMLIILWFELNFSPLWFQNLSSDGVQ